MDVQAEVPCARETAQAECLDQRFQKGIAAKTLQDRLATRSDLTQGRFRIHSLGDKGGAGLGARIALASGR